MPIGYLVTTLAVLVCTGFALAPPRRPRVLAALGFRCGFLLNELPFLTSYWLLASTLLALAQGDLDSPGGRSVCAAGVLAAAGLAVVAARGVRAAPVLERALRDGLGAGWREAVGPGTAAVPRRRRYGRVLFGPVPVRRGDVERLTDLRYGEAGRYNLLDVYRHRSRPSGAPVLIHLHGGALVGGSKSREARPLLYRLASRGWVCVSADYRLSPAARAPDHLVDAKKVIAWVREHGPEYGADADTLLIAGSSAGGQLATLAALTPNRPDFQPGFEDADTSVTAAVSLYGYYGAAGGGPYAPTSYDRRDAPPFLVVHGDRDTVVPADGARRFAGWLRDGSTRPVVYAELPGGQHSFDLFHSPRCEAVVDAVEAFAAWVRSTRA